MTNHDENPLPASNSMFPIEVSDSVSKETREGTSKRGNAEHQGKAELHGMAFVKVGK